MTEQSQQEYLRAAKKTLGVEWDELAGQAGISPRALKTYRMPDTSKDHRKMPSLARGAIDRLLLDRQKEMRSSSKRA